MRISSYESSQIAALAKAYFGEQSEVRLFGSRTDDSKRGGDIDLLILVPDSEVDVAKTLKFKFLDKLQGQIGEQRIDVIITSEERIRSDEFLRSIEGIRL